MASTGQSVQQQQTENARRVLDTIPTLAWSARSDGSAVFFNQRWLDYTGLTTEQAGNGGWVVALHPDESSRLLEFWRSVVASGEPGEIEGHLRRFDGSYRWSLFRATPSRDTNGNVVEWFGTNTDIEDRKSAEETLRAREKNLRLMIDGIPGFIFTATAEGEIEFVNQPILEYTGRTLDQLKRWQVTDLVHPDDLPKLIEELRRSMETGQSQSVEHRVRGADGMYRWFDVRRLPERNKEGRIIRWYLLLTDIHDRKQAEQALRSSEQKLRLMVDSIPGFIVTLTAEGDVEHLNRQTLEYFGRTTEELKNWTTGDVVHKDDLPRVIEAWRHAVKTGESYVMEFRQRRADGAYRWFQSRALPARDPGGRITGWYMLLTDIDDRKHAEEAVQSREQILRLMVDNIPGFIATMTAEGELEVVNRQNLEYFGKTLDEMKNWSKSDAIHPQDLHAVVDAVERGIAAGQAFEWEARARRADGAYQWHQARCHPQRDEVDRIVRWYVLATDIDERKRSEEALRAVERDLRLIFETIPGFAWTMTAEGEVEVVSQQMLEYFGQTLEGLKDWSSFVHPEDRERVIAYWKRTIETGQPYEVEHRLRRADGTYRWFQGRGRPLQNAEGRVVRWHNLLTDIDERKCAEKALEKAYEEIGRLTDRLRDENVLLRQQIDQVFMFEEIVGSSPALKSVLASIVQVASTDSTVLISGETGTGKELIAHAIHKRSQRAGRAFLSVNCASIPPSLVASELFGHEKGAFTGAVQRRQGRFELAHGGTIFLDEIGDLPAETQLALLRVLQERTFERVGGNRVIPTDVRIIAATNRDLTTAIDSGAFRADLFYRLNVFPIQVPPLRERKEDIPVLIDYFVKRYADKAGKRITKIDKNTLELCGSYSWPGNIRELQNIVERSVILCNGDIFRVEQAWLTTQNASLRRRPESLSETLLDYEKGIIEAALAESNGKVAGPNGAAAKLGIPRSTLDARIKQLQIKRYTIR